MPKLKALCTDVSSRLPYIERTYLEITPVLIAYTVSLLTMESSLPSHLSGRPSNPGRKRHLLTASNLSSGSAGTSTEQRQ